jgi:hypothetical protein
MRWRTCTIGICIASYAPAAAPPATNIAIENRYGWAENLGWLSFRNTDGAVAH